MSSTSTPSDRARRILREGLDSKSPNLGSAKSAPNITSVRYMSKDLNPLLDNANIDP
jgi:hypothetical protein